MTGAFAQNVIHFGRYLRAKGLEVTPPTGMDLLTAARLLGLDDVGDIRSGFRSLVVTRPDQLPVFEQAFDLFFGRGVRRPPTADVESDLMVQSYLPVLAPEGGSEEEEIRESSEHLGASYSERLGSRDFGELTPDEIAEVRRMIASMIWKPAEALSRRWLADSRGRRPDMRRTLRNAVGPRSELIEMEFRSRKPRRRPLVIIADVSGSMEKYVEMLLHFAHSAPARMGRVETFVFSSRLTRITHELRQAGSGYGSPAWWPGRVHDWSGGTQDRRGDGDLQSDIWSRRV